MRDILGKLEEDGGDPVRRAQKAMQTPKPKRFYKTAAVAQANGGFAVQLDGKTAKTPGGKPLIVESEKAAALAASEFAAQGEFIDAMSMPVFGWLCRSAIITLGMPSPRMLQVLPLSTVA